MINPALQLLIDRSTGSELVTAIRTMLPRLNEEQMVEVMAAWRHDFADLELAREMATR